MQYTEILDRLCAAYERILGENFVGFYVHGSIAMGCFNPVSSDIDFVCVVQNEPDDESKLQILIETDALSPFAPQKGLEMHVLRLEDCLQPKHPVYFCLHYSPAHAENFRQNPLEFARNMHGNDPDLAAHLTILHACGICWKGLPAAQVFGPVAKEDYLDSILDDVLSLCGDETYNLCNLCRVWGYLAEGLVLSKRAGAQWALAQEIGCKTAISAALSCYNTGEKWPDGIGAQTAYDALREKITSLLPKE